MPLKERPDQGYSTYGVKSKESTFPRLKWGSLNRLERGKAGKVKPPSCEDGGKVKNPLAKTRFRRRVPPLRGRTRSPPTLHTNSPKRRRGVTRKTAARSWGWSGSNETLPEVVVFAPNDQLKGLGVLLLAPSASPSIDIAMNVVQTSGSAFSRMTRHSRSIGSAAVSCPQPSNSSDTVASDPANCGLSLGFCFRIPSTNATSVVADCAPRPALA